MCVYGLMCKCTCVMSMWMCVCTWLHSKYVQCSIAPILIQLSYQPHPGVPPRQCSPGGSGRQWKAESYPASSLCQWTGGLPDPATQRIRSGRPQGICSKLTIWSLHHMRILFGMFGIGICNKCTRSYIYNSYMYIPLCGLYLHALTTQDSVLLILGKV